MEGVGRGEGAGWGLGLPMSGTASEVVGMMAETRFIKTVSERRTVTSERGRRHAEVHTALRSIADA